MAPSTSIICPPVIRLVPITTTAEDFAGTMGELQAHFVRFIRGDENTPRERVYRTRHLEATLHWIEDPRLGLAYAAVTGPDREALAMELKGWDRYYELPELIVRAQQTTTPAERMGAIYQLALAAPVEPDESILAIFRTYLQDKSADVRGACVLAISYVGWDEFHDLLVALARDDEAADVREDAALLLTNRELYPARAIVEQ